MPPTFAALHAPSPEAVPSTLPLTSSVAAALRSRGNRRASDRRPPPLGAFLPPIRDAPCLHGGVLPPTAPSPEAVPSTLLRPCRHLAALHPRATHMIPSPRPCGRRLFSLWAERQCRRVPWARQHPRSFRPERGRPPPVRVAGVMCVIHPSQGRQGGSASTTATHRRWGLSSHPFGMHLVCTGVFCRPACPQPRGRTLHPAADIVGRRGTTQPRQPPSQQQPRTAAGGFPPTHSGCFIYIPSFCEATGRKIRLMLATIERRGCNLQTGLYISPIRNVSAVLLTKFNKSDILNNSEAEKNHLRFNTESTPTQLRLNSDQK